MRYIELCLDTPAELIDLRCEELAALGAEGFVIENEEDFRDFLEHNRQYWDYVDQELESSYAGVSRIKLYLTDDDAGQAVLARILSVFPEASHSLTEDLDWENGWKEQYAPIEVGERLVVVPSWLDAPEGRRIPLRLEPGIAFGTGSHPTTKLTLAALEPYVSEDCTVLDLGCGSGILGIGALILGASRCVGCDIDPLAAEAAEANAALNGIESSRLQIDTGDLVEDAALRQRLGGGYELVLANIVADVILQLAPLAHDFLAPHGVFICSGIIDDRAVEVERALCSQGFSVLSHTQEEEWHCFTCR